jgi:regulator of sigma E protease
MATERYGPFESLARALGRTSEVTRTTLKFLGQMLSGRASADNLSGPLSIAQYAGESARLGPSRFLEFLGLVSVSLAVLNLLPVPMLDGGHLIFYLIESVARRPVPEAVQVYGQQLGLCLLLGLMGLALYNDLMRIF